MWFKFASVGMNPEERLGIFIIRLKEGSAVILFALGVIAFGASGQKVRPFKRSVWLDGLCDVMLEFKMPSHFEGAFTEYAFTMG